MKQANIERPLRLLHDVQTEGTYLKKQTMVFGILAAVLLAGGAAFWMFCNASHFTGSIRKEPDAYRLDAQYMNGADSHTMALHAGDVLSIRFETEKGALHLEIQAPDGSILYSGNGKDATDFTVNITESGNYTVTVKASSARGLVHILRTSQSSDFRCASVPPVSGRLRPRT